VLFRFIVISFCSLPKDNDDIQVEIPLACALENAKIFLFLASSRSSLFIPPSLWMKYGTKKDAEPMLSSEVVLLEGSL